MEETLVSSIWDEPLKFKPERFLNSAAMDFNKANDFELLPFGAGRRICPGLSMAARQVPSVLASLIHCSDWSLPQAKDDHHQQQQLDMNDKFGVTLQKEKHHCSSSFLNQEENYLFLQVVLNCVCFVE